MGKKWLGRRKWGCNKWAFKECLATIPGNRPKVAFFFAPLRPSSPFSGGSEERLENLEKAGEKAFFLLRYRPICLSPHLLNPHLQHPKMAKK